jgi:nucleoside-diphosphate-sugar epimerase
MRIAVTGGSGFIGKNLLKILVKNKKNQIINLYRSKKFNHPRVQNIKFDLYKKINKNFYRNIGTPEYLIHLAWDKLDNYDSKIHLKILKQNIIFFKNLFNSPFKKIFVMGTCFEYGKRSGELKENFKTNPSNNYSISKDSLRKFLFNFFKKKKTLLLWGRLFYVFGEGQNPRTLYGQINKTIKNKKKNFYISKENPIRDYLEVRNVAKIIISLIKKTNKNDIINICSGRPVSLKKLINNWLKKKKFKKKIKFG